MRILGFRSRAALAAASAVTLVLVAVGISEAWPSAAASNTAEDTFTRADTTAGWGTTTNADGLTNLPWQGDFASSSLTVINSDAGRINVTSNGHPLSGSLGVPSNAGGDVLGEVSFSAVGHGAAGLLVQRASVNQWYEAVLDTSKKQLQLIRRVAGVNTVVGTPMSFTAAAGTNYWLRLDAAPSGGTEVISARVWADGSTEPTSWQTTYTDATPLAAGQPGALGIWYTGPGAADHMDFHAFAYAPSGLATPPGGGTAPVFTADSPPAGATVGTSYSYTFTASGSPAPTFSVASGALPAGLSLNPATGVLSGTPTTTGSFSFTVQAANGVSPAAVSPTLTITVSAGTQVAPAITSAASTTAKATTAMSFTVTTTGSPTPTITESGPLPGGVTFTDNKDGTASIAGTPAAGSEGSYPITITAANGVSPNASQAFTLTVNGLAPAFTADSPPATAVIGASYSYTFTASGDPAPTFSVASGTLPAGLSLNSTTGVLSGTPSATGSFSFTVQAANGVSPAATTPTLQIVVSASGTTVATWAIGGAQGTPASTSGVTPGTLVPISQGPPDTMITLTGSGFHPGETVDPIWFNGTTEIKQGSFYEYAPQAVAASNGTVRATMFVPDIYGGAHTVGLLGLTSGLQATTGFTVTTRLDTGATTAPAGTTLNLNGWGFGAKETVTVSWNGTAILSGSTDTKGAFGKTYQIPAGTAPGTYTISAKGAVSGLSTSSTLTVGTPTAGSGPAASDWSNWGFDPQEHRVNPSETTIGPSNVSTLAPLWTRQVFGPDKVTGAIYQANGIAYFGTVDGVIYALNVRSGAIQWMYQGAGSVYESPTAANGLVYFSTVTYSNEGPVGNYAYALNAGTGALVWAQWLPNGAGWDSPTVVGNQVIVEEANKEGASGGEISLGYLTGTINWHFATAYGIWAPGTLDPSGTTLYQDTGNPCVSSGVAGDGCSGSLLAVNVATGSFTTLIHFPDVSGDDDVPTAPAYDNGSLYIGSKNGSEYSINPANGAINWSYNTGSSGDFGIFSSAVVANGSVIFGGGDRLLHSLNESTGALQWTQSIGGGLIYSSPVLANGVLYIESMASTAGKPNVAALDPATGKLLWTFVMSSFAENPPTVSNGILLAGDDGGTVYAFTPGGT
jgi:outer membrane protein assembly factor BamB